MILSNHALDANVIPGISHKTLAGAEHGLSQVAVWSQAMEPNSATPPHYHECEEVVVVLEGEGVVLLGDQEHPFRAGDTMIIPPNLPHQIIARGDKPVRTMAAFGKAPVPTAFPDGTKIELPWDR